MRIAILGATSMLAADFVAVSLRQNQPYHFTLFARGLDRAVVEMARRGISKIPECRLLDSFVDEPWDAIVNFVGVGDPARAISMGADILRVTRNWDDKVLDYLDTHAACRYVFLSSGAAFGLGLADPVDRDTHARFDINGLSPASYYGVAKFHAEVIHRARPDRSIIDLRIFNYFSEYADLNHRFLVTEAIAAIRDGHTLSVDHCNMWRDYLGQEDLSALISACLNGPAGYNGAIDAYSLAPVSKIELLNLFQKKFGLKYDITGGGIDATGDKSNYYSKNREAGILGYRPRASSLDTLESVTQRILSNLQETGHCISRPA